MRDLKFLDILTIHKQEMITDLQHKQRWVTFTYAHIHTLLVVALTSILSDRCAAPLRTNSATVCG